MVGLIYECEVGRYKWNYHLRLAKEAFDRVADNAEVRMKADKDKYFTPSSDVSEALTEVLKRVNNNCDPEMMYCAMMEIGLEEFAEQTKNCLAISKEWKKVFGGS